MYDYSKEKEISVNYDMWVMPKKYSDLVSEGWYDNYYLGNVSIKDRKIVEDNFIKVAVRDSARKFFLSSKTKRTVWRRCFSYFSFGGRS